MESPLSPTAQRLIELVIDGHRHGQPLPAASDQLASILGATEATCIDALEEAIPSGKIERHQQHPGRRTQEEINEFLRNQDLSGRPQPFKVASFPKRPVTDEELIEMGFHLARPPLSLRPTTTQP